MMGFDRQRLAALTGAHGPVVRIVVADIAGSTPREVGAAMYVWHEGQEGTIGGGTLEHEAVLNARRLLAGDGGAARVDRMALGPTLGQCCGGAVTLLSERWTGDILPAADAGLLARPLPGKTAQMPLAVRRALTRARGEGTEPAPRLIQGWFVEPFTKARRDLWVWGAGHVGRAIVGTIAPLPDVHVTWVDTDASRFPAVPEGVAQRIAENPADLVADARPDAEHLVLTFSHALDLELCHRLLSRGFSTLGLIGSATTWARFRSRLAQLGHAPERIGRITCPIGRPALGKHPQAIAIGVALEFLEQSGKETATRADIPDRAAKGGRAG